jgi:hypothetical protein
VDASRRAAESAIEDYVVAVGGSPRFAEPATGWRGAGPDVPRAPVVASTLRFVRRRARGTEELHFVTYDDEDGAHWHSTIRVAPDGHGRWRAGGVGGGVGDVPRDRPWANLAISYGRRGFHAGGRVIGTGAETISRAVVRFDDETLTDTVEHGVVLFLSRTPRHDLGGTTLDLLDAGGHVVSTQSVP